MIAWDTAEDLSNEVGPAFYLFEEDRFRSNLRAFRRAFEEHYSPIDIGYSYKTNYTPYLCDIAHQEGYYAEVVSEMEYIMAKRLRVPAERIIFNGPAKSEAAMKEASMAGAAMNIDSLSELYSLVRLLSETDASPARVVLRCNFEIAKGHSSRFGIATTSPEFEAALRVARTSGVTKLVGLHCHFPGRDLESFERRADVMTTLASSIFVDEPPECINLGGGFMGSMSSELLHRLKLTAIEYEEYGTAIGKRMSRAFGRTGGPTLVLEPGTAVVADTFTFIARVISTKDVFGTNIATIAGSLLDISPASNGAVVPAMVISREAGHGTAREWTIGGFTCIEGDVLAQGLLGTIDVGDYIAFANVGSYSVSMRPPFISPRGAIVATSQGSRPGQIRLIKRPEGADDVLASFGAGEWT
jgi:diaminopimelate decarboxylase